MRLTTLLLISSILSFGQDKKYFTPYFQNMTPEKTSLERTYVFEEEQTLIEDHQENTLTHKATIFGLTKLEEVNEFAWYCLSRGVEIYYRDYFIKARAVFDFYTKGKLCEQLVIRGNKVSYGQVWNNEGQEILINGSGQNNYKSTELDEEIFENYKDSTLVLKYGIRTEKRDTIYYTYDKMASPKEGLQDFYQRLIGVIRYPELARIAGKEGRIYVQFVVDERGKLTDFKPLTKEGYRFEARVVKRLEESPNWNPAMYKSYAVKSKFILPVKFALKD
jgi:hypothetical protein